MESIASQRASELQASVRIWLESLFGRRLGPDEEVTVMAFPSHREPTGSEREEAAAAMRQILDKASANMKDVPPEEFDAAVNEAMCHIRPRPNSCE